MKNPHVWLLCSKFGAQDTQYMAFETRESALQQARVVVQEGHRWYGGAPRTDHTWGGGNKYKIADLFYVCIVRLKVWR